MEPNALPTQAGAHPAAQVVAYSTALPSRPRPVALLMSELAHEPPCLRRVNHLFCTDPALSARLREKPNDTRFGLPRQVAGIPEALGLLGQEQLRALGTSAPLGSARSVRGVNMRQFWRYSSNTARLA